MAWYRQASQPWQAGGIDPSGNGEQRASLRIHDYGGKSDLLKGHSGLARTRLWKGKRFARPASRNQQFSIGLFVAFLLVALVFLFLGADYIFAVIRTLRGEELPFGFPGSHVEENPGLDDSKEKSTVVIKEENVLSGEQGSDEYSERERGKSSQTNIGRQSGSDDESAYTFKDNEEGLHHGQGLDENPNTDLRYWDKDDTRIEKLGLQQKMSDDFMNFPSLGKLESNQTLDIGSWHQENQIRNTSSLKNTGLYNEKGTNKLRKYEEQFGNAPRKELNLSKDHSMEMNREQGVEGIISLTSRRIPGLTQELNTRASVWSFEGGRLYDKGLPTEGMQQLGDNVEDKYNDEAEDVEENPKSYAAQQEGTVEQFSQLGEEESKEEVNELHNSVDSIDELVASVIIDSTLEKMHLMKADVHRSDSENSIIPGDEIQDMSGKETNSGIGSSSKTISSAIAGNTQESNDDDGGTDKEEDYGKENSTGRVKKKKKRPAAACEIAFRNTTSGLREPRDMSIFQSFSLNYIEKEEKPEVDSAWKPRFAGHQSLLERARSYVASNQTLRCGFVEGPEGYHKTGFELEKDDMDYLNTCHIAVSSCIFGNYDHIRNPLGKKVSSSSKEKVCFAMFVDQQSLDGMIDEGEVPDENMTRGLWRIVLIKNLPFSDNRRTGKVPKFLTHRLFPNAKYSIWLDSKLRLQSDPLLILEHFLWRGKHEYAISNHYDRHCVWEEVAQNKKLNKFSHRVIDEQFEFYQRDGLTRFNASDPHKLLPSHVPEGSFIVRAHTPMSNLFSCLWFNEVDRFTPRDQLSFAYTYLKFVRTNPSRHFHFHMFKDCERREMTKLYHHKQEEGGKH